MKIVHVYKDFDPPIRGGMERHIALSCRFQRQWASVSALTCSRHWRTRQMDRDGTPVTETGEFGRFQSAPLSPLFPWRLRRAEADIYVVHMPNPTAELGWLLARPKAVLIVRYHSDVVRQAAAMRFYGPLQMQFLRKAAMILPTSEAYLGSSPVLQAVRERCRVQPLGILPEAFQAPDEDRVAALREAHGGPFVLFSGRHRYYKGLPYLVEAAQWIKAAVVIAGDGPEREKCQALARELNVPVSFPGELDQQDLVNHLHACAVFAFPSVERSEAFGLSMLEAHACGKPVVATRLGTGVEFVNRHGETGLNAPPRDAAELAGAINMLLEDPALAERMGAYAKRRVETELHAETVARREFELYKEALER
ncbi:MAG: glycosyltransferase [Candidatus Hydrogenedentota bacterium]